MPSTNFAVAAFTGQTAGIDLASYVPQSGDLNAVFTRASFATQTGGLVFGTAVRLKEANATTGTSDYTYVLGTAPTSEQVDVTTPIMYGAAGIASGMLGGMTLGINSTTERLSIYVYNDASSSKISVESTIAGTKTTIVANIAVTASANTAIPLVAQVRGTSGNLTLTVLWNGASVINAFALPAATVIAGRGVGVRLTALAANTQETNGLTMNGLTAANFTASAGLTAGTITSVVAGASAGTAIVTGSAATGGTAPYSYQFQRAPDASGSPGTFANVGTAGTSLTLNETGLTQGVTYWYRYIVTDSAGTPATSTSANKSFTVSTPSVELASAPGSMVLRQGEALTAVVTATPSSGYTNTLALSATGLPTGVTASFSPASITGGSGTSTMTLTAAGNAVTGALDIGIQGSDGTLTPTVPFTLQVNPPSGNVYPVVSDVQATDLITITRGGTTDQVAASVLKAYLAS